jgi:hypothetical protein
MLARPAVARSRKRWFEQHPFRRNSSRPRLWLHLRRRERWSWRCPGHKHSILERASRVACSLTTGHRDDVSRYQRHLVRYDKHHHHSSCIHNARGPNESTESINDRHGSTNHTYGSVGVFLLYSRSDKFECSYSGLGSGYYDKPESGFGCELLGWL